jgi:hypothetical protein
MVEITAITTTLSAAVTALKEIVSLAEKAGNKEINQRVMGLQQVLLTINAQLTELAVENQTLRHSAGELARLSEIEKEIVYEESVYWRTRDGKRIDGPLCPNCWDAKRMLIHLTPGSTKGTYSCGVCGNGFYTSDYRPVTPTPKRGGI